MELIPFNDRTPLALPSDSLPQGAQVEMAATEEEPQTDENQTGKIPQPEISIIVDGNQVFKPGMKGIFIEDEEKVVVGDKTGGDDTVDGGSYCSCNAVNICTCNMVCTCESVCTCLSVCTCNTQCSCVGHCSCDQVCTCNSQCSCQQHGGGTTYCSCVPVH